MENEYLSISDKLWKTMHDACDLLTRCEESIYGETGVSGTQCSVLMTLARQRERPSITALALLLNRNVNSMSAIIDRMERNDLVKRMKHNGGKTSVIALSTMGKRISGLASEKERKLVDRMLSENSLEDLKTCLRVMERMKIELVDMSERWHTRAKRMAG